MEKLKLFRPLYDDLLFKEGLSRDENRLFLEYFLETMLDLPKGSTHKKLVVHYECPILKKNYFDKGIRADMLVDYLDYTIDLECYTFFDEEAKEKTMCYAHRLASLFKIGDSYCRGKKIIQIVIIQNMQIAFNKGIINEYLITNTKDSKDTLCRESFKLYYFLLNQLDNAQTYNYNEDVKIRWLKFIAAKTEEERKTIAKGDALLMEFDKNLNEYMMDAKSKQYFQEWDLQIYQHQAERRGIEKGQKRIAKNLLDKGLDLSFVQETTGLSKKELIQLQQEY